MFSASLEAWFEPGARQLQHRPLQKMNLQDLAVKRAEAWDVSGGGSHTKPFMIIIMKGVVWCAQSLQHSTQRHALTMVPVSAAQQDQQAGPTTHRSERVTAAEVSSSCYS